MSFKKFSLAQDAQAKETPNPKNTGVPTDDRKSQATVGPPVKPDDSASQSKA